MKNSFTISDRRVCIFHNAVIRAYCTAYVRVRFVRFVGVAPFAVLVVAQLAVAVLAGSACTPASTGDTASPAVDAPTGQRGIALPSWDTQDYRRPQARAYVSSIAATGAGWIQLNPTWYMRSARGDRIFRTNETAADAALLNAIRLAQRARLKVFLKPHVDLPGDTDRASIRPARGRADRWWASYTRFIGHYAEVASRSGVAQFAVGTELAGVSRERARWLKVIKAVRSRYSGPLVYAANYDDYRRVSFWDRLDLIGIDAYWPLAGRATTDVAALRRAWRPIVAKLAGFSAATRRRILFTEAGYVSQRGSTTAPYAWEISKVNGNAEQAAAYEALLATFTPRTWWAGVHWWMWDDWPGSATTPRELAYTPRGKPAEQVIRRWWRPGPRHTPPP